MKSSWNSRKQEDPEVVRLGNLKVEINNMYRDVCKTMTMHDSVTTEFKQKQQQYFLKTFAVIMDRMSEELKIAQEKYKNIDLEIQKDQEVIRLQKEVYFFRQECLALKDEVKRLKQSNEKLNGFAQNLKEQKAEQYLLLLQRTKEKKALINRLDRNSSGERPVTSMKSSTCKDPFQQTTAICRTTNNLRRKNARSMTKHLTTTRPVSDYESSTGRDDSRERKVEKRNQLFEIWSDCVKQIRGNNQAMKFLAKQTKLKALGTFFSMNRVVDFLSCRMFGKQCCENPKCRTNLTGFALTLDIGKTKIFQPGVDKPLSQRSRVDEERQCYTPFRKFRENQPLIIHNSFFSSTPKEYQ